MLMRLFFRGTINEGWKNWMMAIVLVVMSLGNIQQANAQNVVVDDLKNPKEVVKIKYDSVMLDPNEPIGGNVSKIENLLYLHGNNNYVKYITKVKGYYLDGNRENYYDFPIGTIYDDDNLFNDCPIPRAKDEFISREIIDILTNLYSHSLGEKFQVNSEEYDSLVVDAGIFYYLLPSSSLYEKIHDKVEEEINEIRHTGFPKLRLNEEKELD